jgi:3-oxoadipate enol-lactonase / 4-carboxymuconolactone decarboxylase
MSKLAYSIIHDADPAAPVLILGPSLGTTQALWAGVAYRLADDFRVVTFDLPGHGRSPRIPEVTIDRIAECVLEIADELNAPTFGYAGISISGGLALALALKAPERVRAIGALCCGARFGDTGTWEQRIATVRADGTRGLIPDTADRWFAAGFIDEDNAAGPIVLEMLANTDDEGYIDCCRALEQFDIDGSIDAITTPSLFLAGAQDPSNPPESMRALHERVAGSRFAVIPDAAHLPVAEHPELVADRLKGFFEEQLSAASSQAG